MRHYYYDCNPSKPGSLLWKRGYRRFGAITIGSIVSSLLLTLAATYNMGCQTSPLPDYHTLPDGTNVVIPTPTNNPLEQIGDIAGQLKDVADNLQPTIAQVDQSGKIALGVSITSGVLGALALALSRKKKSS